jgi:hypothetical protein
MLDVVAQSAAINLAYLCLALLVAWFVLLWLDRRLARGKGVFNAHFRTMHGNALALAVYLGRRFLGIC